MMESKYGSEEKQAERERRGGERGFVSSQWDLESIQEWEKGREGWRGGGEFLFIIELFTPPALNLYLGIIGE